jgi:hypothetical protein
VAAITPAAHGAGSSISLDIEENLVGVLDQTAVEQIIENYYPMPSDTARQPFLGAAIWLVRNQHG